MRCGRVVLVDKLRQERHEEQHDLWIEQIDADAGQEALAESRLLPGAIRYSDAATLGDGLPGEPDQVDSTGDLERVVRLSTRKAAAALGVPSSVLHRARLARRTGN